MALAKEVNLRRAHRAAAPLDGTQRLELDMGSEVLTNRTKVVLESQAWLPSDFSNHTGVVNQLIRHGCLVDLMTGISHTQREVVRLLLTASESTTLEDSRGLCAMDWATEPRHAAVRQIPQQHMDAGAPCTQLIAVSDGSAGPSAQPRPQGAGAADEAGQGPATGRRRASRFHCHKADCPNSEQSLHGT
jgi:hypothetical protein